MKMYGDPEKRLLDIPEQVYPILPQSWWKSTLNVMQNNRFYVVVLVILIGTGIAIAFISRDTAHQQNDIITDNQVILIGTGIAIAFISRDTAHQQNDIITDNQGWIILKSLGWNMKYAADDQNPYNNGPQQYQSMNNVRMNTTTNGVEINLTLYIDTIYPYGTSNKAIISANYSFPGPLIEAYEGDILVIRVINQLDVPTTMHWHGLYQTTTPDMDGAVGITQCAIAPKNEMIYKFKAEPAGTAWYHGHLLEQYTDGLYGPLIIHQRNEPNQDKYDSEQVLMVADWYNLQAHTQLLPWYLNPNNTDGNEPSPDATVVNGKFTQALTISISNSSRIRFRVINTAAFSMYNVSIDGLPLHIIELDQVDTLPYTVNSFNINVAQRVSFYIDLSELSVQYTASGNLSTNAIYIRFQAMLSMYPVDILNYIPPYEQQRYPYPTFFNPLYLAILSFNGTNSTPSYSASLATPTLQNTVTPIDTNILAARPFYQNTTEIPNATYYLGLIIVFNTSTNGINYAYLNNVTYSSDANYMSMTSAPTQGITSDEYAPLLHQMVTKPNNLSIPSPRIEPGSSLPTIQSDGYGHYLVPYEAVVDIFLNNTDTGEHPFHLHGHKFWIIATSDYPNAEFLYAGNYIQRDTVSVPALGWAKIRYVANKPGAWLFHCHIEWHMSAGLALVFITSPEQLLADRYTVSSDAQQLCQALQKFNKKQNSK
ncbi:unnamed protein product [Adineta steineri]|uniref:Multicopper oxidase n=1 Tax=Adineta steineri TaxID=433720 RepID=A0A814TC09_9BILA|nr:unnamed protein product [Adineta steineri]